MDAILQSLHELEGVNGAVVADGGGHILAYKAHALYDLPLLQQVTRAVVGAIDSVKLLHADWESVTAQFSEGKLLIRSLSAGANRGKGPELTLSVIADMRVNLSFAGVALRVAVSKLRNVMDSSLSAPAFASASGPLKLTSQVSAPSAPGVSTSAIWPPPSQAASLPTRVGTPEAASSALNWSGFGAASGMSGSGFAATDPASSSVLAACTKALARSVGPMAKRYVKEALGRICSDRPFSHDLLPVLVSELEKYLEDPSDAAAFRRLALKSA
jgi:predicted regulator of Ras-like GTPase activity (Roadblock/LC7/MglB family)